MGTDGCQDGHCLDTIWDRKGEKTTQTGTPLHSWKHSDWCADINMIHECKFLYYKNENDRKPANSGESMATILRTGAWKESWFSSFCSFDVMLYQEAKPNAFDEETIENQVHLQDGTSWTGSAEVQCWNHHQEGSNQSQCFLRSNVASTANLQLAVTLATQKLFSPPSEFPRTWLRPWWISPGSQSVRRCAVCRWIFECGLQKGSAHGPRHICIVLSRAPWVLCASRCCLICFIPPAGSASAELWKMPCPVPLELETLTTTSHSCWNTGRLSELHWSPPDQRVAVEVPCTAWKE